MKWITRERPKIDRIACPWLIARFVDKAAEFLYVPDAGVLRIAKETGAIPFDVPDVELGHHGELCSFDAFLERNTRCMTRRCSSSRQSCEAPIPDDTISPRKQAACMRFPWAYPAISGTTSSS